MTKATGVVLWRSQLLALLKKNFLLKARNRRMTLLEIFFPLYFLFILMMITWSLPTDTLPEEMHFPAAPTAPYSIYCLTAASDSLLNRCTLAYAPDDSPLVTEVMQRIHDPGVHLLPFANADDIQDYYQSHPEEIWAAIVWGDQAQLDSDKSSHHMASVMGPQEIGDMQFTIQMNQTKLIGQQNSVLVTSGFFALQARVQQSVINQNLADLGMNRTVTVATSTKMFPQRPQEIVTRVFSALWALMLPFSFSYLMQGIISIVVTEKKEKLKEGMKMMGLKETVYWISWMITQMIVNIITSTLYVVGGTLLDIFTNTPPMLAWTTFMLYTTAIISVAFFSSVFFSNPKTATSVSMMVFLVQLTVAGIMQYFLFGRDEAWVVMVIYVASLVIPPLSMMQMAIYFAEAKVVGVPLTLTTAQPAFYPVYLALLFQATNIFLYAFLAWYVSNLLPGEYGTSKRPWFIFLPSYWSPSYQVMQDDVDEPLLSVTETAEELAPSEISIRRLRKVYPRGIFCRSSPEDVVAVDQLSLEIRRGEILALLGHNGAGKSTTIGMLTGLFPPTGGDALIQGFSVRQNMDAIRADIGVCPQHDILFEQLTAVEHLELYAALKGVPSPAVRSQVDDLLEMVGLNAEEHAHKHTKGFSGGMKRKLSVAIALIGGSSVIFLDECTAGMDPLSRREIWKLLQELKSERTIVLTTHYMEEADILGDRIAIMSKGNLKVLGTSVELKNQYGSGYYLVLTKQEECDPQSVADFLEEHFEGAQRLLEDKPSELSYQVPTEYMDRFGAFFTALDENLERLGVASYGIYTTTLEEVFLKIADDDDASLKNWEIN